MKTFKRALSCFLALLMIFGSCSVLSYAALDDGNQNTFQVYTKFFVDGVETEKVQVGDTVKARVYLKNDYLMAVTCIMFVYPTAFMEFVDDDLAYIETADTGDKYGLNGVLNPSTATYAGSSNFEGYIRHQVGYVVDSYSPADNLVFDGFVSEDYFDDKGWIGLTIEGGKPVVATANDDDDYLAEFTFTVKDTASEADEGYFSVVADSILTPDNIYGFTCCERSQPGSTFTYAADDYATTRYYNLDLSLDTNTIKIGEAEVAKYAVNYVYEGTVPAGYDAPAAIELEEGAAIADPEVTIPAGYTLTWTKSGDVNGAMGTADVTMTGTWAKIPYAVNYVYAGTVPAGFTAPAATTATIGDKIVVPEIDAPAGYELAWTMTGDVNGAMGTETVTVTGTWSKIAYAVNYVYAGTVPAGYDAPEATTATIGDEIVYPAVDAPAGYKLAWSMAGDVDGFMGTDAVTVTGTWSKIPYTVSTKFEGEVPAGVNVPSSFKVTVGDEFDAPAVDVPAGYELAWDVTGATLNDNGKYVAGANKIEFVGTWSKIAYAVNYVYAGEVPAGYDAPAATTATIGDAIVIPEVAAPAGYELVWTMTGDVDGKMGADAVTVTGTWSKILYAVNYVYAGEVPAGVTAPAATTATIGDAIVIPEVTAPAGYTLTWAMAGDVDGKMGTDAVTVTGTWSKNTYTITYYLSYEDMDDGVVYDTQTYKFGEAITPIADPVVEGKIFDAWDIDFPATMGTENLEAVASFTDKRVVFYNIYGDEINVLELVDEITEADLPSADDATDGEDVNFVEWQVNGEKLETPYSIDVYEIEVYPYCTVEVVFYTDETLEDVYDTLTFDFGDMITEEDIVAIGEPTKKGYTFVDWDVYFDGQEATANAETYAIYDANTYEATFMANGEVYDTVEAVFDEEIELPATNPAKTGYTFIGWALEEDGTPVDEFVMTEEGMTFYAVFVENGKVAYTVEIYLMDETGAYTTPVKAGGTATIGTTVTVAHADYAQDAWFSADMAETNVYSAEVKEDGSTTLKLYFKRAQYTVAIDSVGATEVYHGATITAPSEIANVPEGYYLASWNDGAYAPGAEIVVTSDLTLVPTFAAGTSEYVIKTYTMGLDGTYGEAVVETKTATTGTTVTYTAPAIEGFTADAETYSTVVRGDGKAEIVVYYARNQYDVVINGESTKVYYGATITAPTEAKDVPAGYELESWNDGAYTPGQEIEVTGSITFTPDFVAVEVNYTVEIYLMDAEGNYALAETKTEAGVTATTATAAHADYAQAEYYVADMDADNKFSAEIAGDGSTVLELYYARVKYDVTIDGTTTQEYYGATVVAPATAKEVPAGYELASWNNGAYAIGEEIIVTDALTLTPDFAAVEVNYTIKTYTMGLDGAYGEAEVTTLKAVTGTTVTYTAPAKEGFTADAENYTAEVKGDGTTEIVVKYARNQYDVVINGESTKVYYGATITAPTEAKDVPAGYELESWNDGAYAPGQEIEVTGPITFTPDFVAAGTTYKVEIYLMDAEGNYALAETKTEAGVTATTATAAHADYAQAEYYIADMAADNKFTAEITGDGSTTLKLYYKRATYTVAYEDEAGTALGSEEVMYGAAITAPAYATPDGMTLLGWFDKETSEKMPATMPAKNVTYVIKFAAGDATPYTIQINIMDVDGENYITTETQALGTTGATQTIVADYGRVGFTVNTEKSNLTDTIKGDGSTVLSVYYDRNLYTAKFDGVEYQVYYGAALPTVEPAAQVGKEFAGWTPEVPAKMPAENLEFTAEWTDVMYKLIYIINGEEEVYEYAAGATVTPIDDPVVSGMTFLGWNTTIPTVMPADDVIIVAKFEAAVFKATFLDADGKVYDEKAVKCGDAIIVPATNPTKEYNVFKGWEGIPADGLMPACDLTIYPIFERVPVRLVAAEGSTTVINRETMIITGLTTKMDAVIAEDYLAVEGDGYYTLTAVGNYSRFGTGAKVEVYDNADASAPIETFYIVIYGDVNGDSAVNSLDGSIVKSEALYDTNWSRNDTVDTLKVMAADLVKDGKIKNADADIIYNTALGVTSIDQATGTVVR